MHIPGISVLSASPVCILNKELITSSTAIFPLLVRALAGNTQSSKDVQSPARARPCQQESGASTYTISRSALTATSTTWVRQVCTCDCRDRCGFLQSSVSSYACWMDRSRECLRRSKAPSFGMNQRLTATGAWESELSSTGLSRENERQRDRHRWADAPPLICAVGRLVGMPGDMPPTVDQSYNSLPFSRQSKTQIRS